jgi:hypothetical protein
MKYEMEINDDIQEMGQFFIEVIKLAKSGAPMESYMALLPKLMSAVDGYDKAFSSMSSNMRNANIAYLLHELAEILVSDEPEVEPIAEEAPAEEAPSES